MNQANCLEALHGRNLLNVKRLKVEPLNVRIWLDLGKLFNGKQENMGGSDAIKQNEAYFPDLCCDSS